MSSVLNVIGVRSVSVFSVPKRFTARELQIKIEKKQRNASGLVSFHYSNTVNGSVSQ